MSTGGEMSPRRLPLCQTMTTCPGRSSSASRRNLPLFPGASLVSKRWCSLVVDPQFQRRFRDHHGKPPLLGLFLEDSPSSPFVPILDRPDRIPRARFSMPLSKGNRIVDCCHGLVLLLSRRPPHRLLVWDPVARGQRRLIVPPQLDNGQMLMFNEAVLRPARSQGSHFQVALIAQARVNNSTRVFTCLYSSATGVWSNINSLQLQSFMSMVEPSTLIGNSFCWLLTVHPDHRQYVVLEFDLDKQSLTVTELPPQVKDLPHKLWIVPLPTEDGGLGFVHLSRFHGQLWKREPGSVWVLDRTIEFEVLRSACKGYPLTLVGFSEDSNAILVQTISGVFMVYLRSMEFKKLSNMGGFRLHYPFACFYPAAPDA